MAWTWLHDFITFGVMKKTLILVRHAKSSWTQSGIKDMDRPLNERGQRDAPFMAKRMRDSGLELDHFVSSPALRARTTANEYAKAFGRSEGEVELQESVYEAEVSALMEIINSFKDEWKTVALFGHNPGFSYLLEYLSGQILHMPTNGVAVLEMDVERWEHAGTGCATLVDYDYPKKHLPSL